MLLLLILFNPNRVSSLSAVLNNSETLFRLSIHEMYPLPNAVRRYCTDYRCRWRVSTVVAATRLLFRQLSSVKAVTVRRERSRRTYTPQNAIVRAFNFVHPLVRSIWNIILIWPTHGAFVTRAASIIVRQLCRTIRACKFAVTTTWWCTFPFRRRVIVRVL